MQSPPQFALRLEQLEPYLVSGSLLYLALPYAIFCVGWLHWYWAALAIALLVVALVESSRIAFRQVTAASSSPETPPRFPIVFTPRHLVILLLISLVWLSLSGVGGVGYQRGDWVKHESILKDLIEHDWPVVYDFYAFSIPLVYYLAFYLPAALVGKVGGWAVAQVALFVWSFLGVNLAMLWFWVLVRKASTSVSCKASHQVAYSVFLIFIFFSGLDLIGNRITQGIGGSLASWEGIEGWLPGLQYSANATLLYWVPNQALAGWIAGGVTIYAFLYIRHKRIAWLPVALSALWTPFVTIGLLPYLAAEVLSDAGPLRVRMRRYLSWSNLCGLLLLLLVALFYQSKLMDASPYPSGEIPHGFFLTTASAAPPGAFSWLVLFWLVEVGVYVLLLFKSMKWEGRLWRWLLGVTVICLALLPLYRLGVHNDLVMRASIPALFCLAALVARTVRRDAVGLPTRVALIITLLLGAGTAVVVSMQQVSGIYREAMGLPHEEPPETRGIVEVYGGRLDLFSQYVGSYDAPFFRYIAREQDWTDDTSGIDDKRYIAFGDHTILFESYVLEQDSGEKSSGLQPGEQVQMVSQLHLFVEAIDKNYNISIRLVAEDGREVWREQGWPQNRPTSIWAPSLQWFDTRTLTIPADTPDGIYRLDLSFVDPENHDLLPAFAVPSGEYLGEMVPVGTVTVGEVESRPAHLFPEPAQLGGKVVLLGMTPDPDELVPSGVLRGESLQIELLWQALVEMDRDYTGFVHLLDAEGRLVAQHDHPPRNGFLPTSIWREGLVVADGYTLLVPQDVSPGRYSLVAGMYELASGVRLPVWQGGKSVGDSVILTHVKVQ